MIRFLNICVIFALVLAAAHVYKIKFESTRQAGHLAKLRVQIRQEHDAVAALRAEWSRLDNPVRIQQLAARHLALKPIAPQQFDRLDHLPERPVEPETSDPVAALLEKPETKAMHTSSVATASGKR
jgi:cell division protein FtsL